MEAQIDDSAISRVLTVGEVPLRRILCNESPETDAPPANCEHRGEDSGTLEAVSSNGHVVMILQSCSSSQVPSSPAVFRSIGSCRRIRPLHCLRFLRGNIATCARLHVSLYGGLQCLGVCSDNLADFLTVLEEHECRHSTDSEFLSNVWDLVYVELEETCGRVLVGHSMKESTCQHLPPSPYRMECSSGREKGPSEFGRSRGGEIEGAMLT